MKDLTHLSYDRNIKFASLDINNIYSNNAIKEMLTTVGTLCEINNIEDKTKQDILKITQAIVEKTISAFKTRSTCKTKA